MIFIYNKAEKEKEKEKKEVEITYGHQISIESTFIQGPKQYFSLNYPLPQFQFRIKHLKKKNKMIKKEGKMDIA